jgi:hypothetical protein
VGVLIVNNRCDGEDLGCVGHLLVPRSGRLMSAADGENLLHDLWSVNTFRGLFFPASWNSTTFD